MHVFHNRPLALACACVALTAVFAYRLAHAIFIPLCVLLSVVAVTFAVLYFINGAWFDSLLPNLFARLALFSQYAGFMYGYFDLSVFVLYLSVTVFFLFLTQVTMEKRRLL